ncbi:MAG TPA: hypothetical protein VK914_11230 [bacterium]|jgi:hypothetical protein|nr:hypothetical protein [bacterium]
MSRRLGELYWIFLALVLLVVLARTLAFHSRMIAFPYPLDLSEPAQGLLAQGVAAGYSTGDPANFPELSNHYGPFYSLVTGALCRFGIACDLRSQRMLSAVFIALLLLILGLVCRRARAGWLETAALALWAYELLLIHLTPIARPDALGTLLWFAGLALPFLAAYSGPSLALAALLFALAGLTKVYFLVGPLFLALGLILLRRPRALAIFVAFQGLALALAGLWIAECYPYDLYVSVLNQTNNLNFDQAHMLLQLWVLLWVASPCFAPLLIGAGLSLRRDPAGEPDGREWGLYGALGLLLFITVFGGAEGGLFTYLVQLAMLPFAAWFAFFRPARPLRRGLLCALLVLNAVCASRVAVHKGFEPGGPVLRNWEAADALVAKARQPVVSSDLDLSVEARGLPVFDTGLSDFSWLLFLRPETWKTRLFPHSADMVGRYRAWQERTRLALENPRTDLVEVTDYGHYGFWDLLHSRFRPLGRIQIAYPQCGWAVYWLEFYVPKGPAPASKENTAPKK